MSLSYRGALKGLAVGTAFVAAMTVALPRPVQADTTSTALFAVGAAAIVGALLYDGNNRPYYINNNRRYYVSPAAAAYYRSHHQGYVRQAWVPEREYPVAQNGGYNMRRDSYQNRDQGR
jgi:hypothetical protein